MSNDHTIAAARSAGQLTRDLASYLEFAKEVAELGGRVAIDRFGKHNERKKKDDGTWATEADWKTEAQMRLRIARTFPDHNILGEEEGLTSAGGGPPRDGAPTWVLDPIDGTNNYIAGIPIWATLVGLQLEGRAQVGVAHAPAIGETYDGAVGLGARMNGTRIGIDPIDDLSDALFVFASGRAFEQTGWKDLFHTLLDRTGRSRGFGDFWGHMLVARGAAHIMVEPTLRVWDVVALQPIVTEAGGKLTQLDGSSWSDERSCVTTNGVLHDEVLRLAAEMPARGG
ncbi:MAG TPA: inositol monophosphatase family protein [Actinomycetota bacterium]|nr:inositol monophosphatase family protein [Actinomycetota bacterium]